MIPEEKEDVLKVMREAIQAIKENRLSDLHSISDHILHTMSIYQDVDVIDTAVAIYAIDKILQTEKYSSHPKRHGFLKTCVHLLEKAVSQIERGKYNLFSETIVELLANIQGFTKAIRFYIEDILHFARIKKGTKLYEHGLSLGQAAEAMGVSKWELMPAIGETAMHEKFPAPVSKNEKRMKLIRKMFGV